MLCVGEEGSRILLGLIPRKSHLIRFTLLNQSHYLKHNGFKAMLELMYLTQLSWQIERDL